MAGWITPDLELVESDQLGRIHQILQRLDVHYKRGRRYVHSPDVAYDDKLALIAQAYEDACLNPQQVVFLYQDEFTYYRCPEVATGYGQAG